VEVSGTNDVGTNGNYDCTNSNPAMKPQEGEASSIKPVVASIASPKRKASL
jgi:hypothetical protein